MTDNSTDLPCGLQSFNPPGFLSWWMYSAGASKVPPQFTLWAAISALAACVADRVWCSKFADEKIYPNLYVMLIGPSGTGKNQAWRRAQRRVELAPPSAHEHINLYRGKATAEGMLSYLAKGKNNRIWLVTPELAMQVGSGPKAESFITHMTELMDADQPGFQDMTRTSGHLRITHPPTINWGSGTTQEWLVRSVGRQDILGGFFARICAVTAERNPVRYAKIVYPHDYAEVNAWLTSYLAHLTQVSGLFTLDVYADELHSWWYDNRPEPANTLLWPFYEHGDNLVYKLCMILALSQDYRLIGEYHHMDGAITLYEWLYAQLGSVLEFAHRNPEVEKLDMVAGLLASAPFLTRKALLRTATSRGLTRDDLERLLKTLVERGDARPFLVGREHGYQWVGEM